MMTKKGKEIKVLVLDDDEGQSLRIAKKVEDIAVREGLKLTVEISDNAYFAAKQLCKRPPRWDIVFADVMMPLPKTKQGHKDPSDAIKKTSKAGLTCWNSIGDHAYASAQHGGFHVVKTLRALRDSKPSFKLPQVALISSEMRERRSQLRQFLPQEAAWVDFFDKDEWIFTGRADEIETLTYFALMRALLKARLPNRTAIPELNRFVGNSVAMTEFKKKVNLAVMTAVKAAKISLKVIWLIGSEGSGVSSSETLFRDNLAAALRRESVHCKILNWWEMSDEERPLTGEWSGEEWTGSLINAAKDGILFLERVERFTPRIHGLLSALLKEGKIDFPEAKLLKIEAQIVVLTVSRSAWDAPDYSLKALKYAVPGKPIFIPELNDRKDDLLALTEQFLSASGTNIKEGEAKGIEETLKALDWTGKSLKDLEALVTTVVSQAHVDGGLTAARIKGVVSNWAPRGNHQEPVAAKSSTPVSGASSDPLRMDLFFKTIGAVIQLNCITFYASKQPPRVMDRGLRKFGNSLAVLLLRYASEPAQASAENFSVTLAEDPRLSTLMDWHYSRRTPKWVEDGIGKSALTGILSQSEKTSKNFPPDSRRLRISRDRLPASSVSIFLDSNKADARTIATILSHLPS